MKKLILKIKLWPGIWYVKGFRKIIQLSLYLFQYMYLIIWNIIRRISLLNRRGTCVDFQNLMKAVNTLYSVSFIKPCFKFDGNHILQVSFSPHFFRN